MRPITACLALALAACSNAPHSAPPEAAGTPRAIGGERDAHGCLPAAGYRWCARTARCERPWELARARGFENSEAGFRGFCGNPAD